MAGKRLSRKHQVFAAAYAACWNSAQAAIQAGYSERRAKQTGHELLKKPAIREAVNAAVQARLDELCVTQQRLLLELAAVSFGRLNQVVSWGPDHVTLIDSDELTEAEAASVESVGEVISKTGDRTYKIKQHSKLQAIQMMIQLLALTEDEAALVVQFAAAERRRCA